MLLRAIDLGPRVIKHALATQGMQVVLMQRAACPTLRRWRVAFSTSNTMTIAQLVPLIAQFSMTLIIFAVGLGVAPGDVGRLLERRGLLLRAVLAMNIAMPAFALAMVLLFDLSPAVEIALVATALAPVPPILPGKELKAGGDAPSILGVLVVTSLLSIVFIPAAIHVLAQWFGRPVQVVPASVAKIVFTSVLLPLAAGLLVRRLAPSLAVAAAHPLSTLAAVMLGIAFVPVLIAEWPKIAALIGNFTLVAIVAFVVAGLAIGHALGGPDPNDRSVLALSTATRHPAVAMAIAHDAHDRPAVLAAVLLILLVGAVISTPYVKWRKRSGDVAGARLPSA
jgi:bile acid:Na+ symporter, BASS family